MRASALFLLIACLVCLTGCLAPAVLNQSNDAVCQIASDQQHAPGWPYSLDTFNTSILPMLKTSCASAGCHAPPGQAGFAIFADAQPGNCSYAQTFNALTQKTDLTNPANSAVYVAITGGDPAHPLKLAKSDPTATTLLAFVQQASNTANGNGTGNVPVNANPFDYATYQSAIQPIVDSGCSNGSCHGAMGGIGGFAVVANPAPNSADMQANFNTITSICNLQTPNQSKFYLQATIAHASGHSTVVSATQAQTILSWIQQAQANAGSGAGSSPSCADPNNFDLAVFKSDIEPILLGNVDLNSHNGQFVSSGCARGPCHGADRTGGALVLKPTNTSAQNLQNFACFVRLSNPSSSPVLSCPLNAPGCPKSPHPGQNVFLPGNTDLNYQRILSYLYASKTATTPLDFAYYARQINSLFNDVNVVQNGGQNRSCADTVSCHGIATAGAPIPNGSVFGVIANNASKDALLYNFSIAANFTNFINAQGSTLFLFPTDEIANPANPFSTGLHHPGGLDFAKDSAPANAILTWASGLRPDGNGYNLNWLVAGTYPASQITDTTAIDEVNVNPAIFDSDGAPQFNAGQWDGLFSPATTIDLGAAFPQANNSGRVAYAVAYVFNTSPNDIQAQLTIVSPNVIKVYADQQPIQQTANAGGDGAPALVVLPAYSTSKKAVRLLVKVFQRATDTGFSFSARFQDQFGRTLTNTTGELIFKLGPNGGV